MNYDQRIEAAMRSGDFDFADELFNDAIKRYAQRTESRVDDVEADILLMWCAGKSHEALFAEM